MNVSALRLSLTVSESRHDIIQAVVLGSAEGVIEFCKGIQAAAPVDAHVTPEPWAMPGYDSEVIMAAGAFIQGSSIELSADAPIKPPYSVYFQGGITWYHSKLGIVISLEKLYEAGLVKLSKIGLCRIVSIFSNLFRYTISFSCAKIKACAGEVFIFLHSWLF